MKQAALRVGIVGVGDVLSAYMSTAGQLQRQGLIQVVAACGRTAKRKAEVQQAHGVSWFTTDYRELVGSPEIDLVLVLSPAQTHGEIASAALRAGKHVLVEKPMATSLAEAASLVDLARQSPGHLFCAPFTLLSPTYQAIAGQLRHGAIGRVLSARGLYGWAGPWWAEWFYQRGAGVIVDFGVYNLTSLTGLLGPARRVAAATAIAIPERNIVDAAGVSRRVRVEAEDNAQVLLDFGAGVMAAVTTGFTIQRYRRPALELYGVEGTLQMLGDDWAPQGYELWQNSTGAWKVYYETDPFWSWTDGLRHLVACIGSNAPPLVTPEHAYHVLEIMLKAKIAAKEGMAQPVESTFSLPAIPPPTATHGMPAHLVHDPRGRQP
jgi:predicted dehydrogenase